MSYCYCDYDMPSFFQATKPTAKKTHQCSECRRAISPGQKYERYTGMWGGDFNSYKRCQKCSELLAWIKAHVPCFCDSFGGLIEEAYETAMSYSELWFGINRRILRAQQQPQFVPMKETK